MTSSTTRVAAKPQLPLRPITVGWVVRRAALGIAILIVSVGAMAWLTYASIDPDLDIGSGAALAGEPAPMTQAASQD